MLRRAPAVGILSAGVLVAGLPTFVASAGTAGVGYSVQSDGDDQLYSIDLATGVETAIGPTGFSDIEGLTFDPNGVLYGVDDVTDQLLTCSIVTGACTAVGPLNVSITDMGLTFDRAGNLWMSTDAPSPEIFYRLNPATGEATAVGEQGQEVTGLAARGSTIYGLGGDNTDNLVTMNPMTGAATNVGPLGSVSLSDGGIGFLGHTLYGIHDGGELFTIDVATGAATVVAPTANGFEGLAIFNPQFCKGKQATLVGTSGDDLLVGTPGHDVIVALEGDDVVRSRAGRDLVCAGKGNDTILGQAGRDTLLGQGGNDTFRGGGGKDDARGGAGRDLVSGGGAADILRGNGGDDTVRGQSGNDTLLGHGGDDKLVGGAGIDECKGGAGSNTLVSCET